MKLRWWLPTVVLTVLILSPGLLELSEAELVQQQWGDDGGNDDDNDDNLGGDGGQAVAHAAPGGDGAGTDAGQAPQQQGAKNIHSRPHRLSCPYWQHMGCFADCTEKVCQPHAGGKFDMSYLNFGDAESIWICCCPLPYKNCTVKERDAKCMASLSQFIKPLTPKATQLEVLTAIQKARNVMREANENCKKYTSALQPFSKCGTGKPGDRNVERADLFCETVTWQWEELGDGNPAELKKNGCPLPAVPLNKNATWRHGNFGGQQGQQQDDDGDAMTDQPGQNQDQDQNGFKDDDEDQLLQLHDGAERSREHDIDIEDTLIDLGDERVGRRGRENPQESSIAEALDRLKETGNWDDFDAAVAATP